MVTDPLQLLQRPGVDLVGVVAFAALYMLLRFGSPQMPLLNEDTPETDHLKLTVRDAQDFSRVKWLAGELLFVDLTLLVIAASIGWFSPSVPIVCDVAASIAILATAVAAWFGYLLMTSREENYHTYLGLLSWYSAGAYIPYALEIFTLGNNVHWVNRFAHGFLWLYFWATDAAYVLVIGAFVVLVWRGYQLGQQLRSLVRWRRRQRLHRDTSRKDECIHAVPQRRRTGRGFWVMATRRQINPTRVRRAESTLHD